MNELLIGKLQGVEPTAYYSRGVGLVDMFNGLVLRALSPLTVAIYATDARAGVGGARLFLAVQTNYTGVGWPFLTVLAILAEPVVQVLYGPAWGSSVIVVRILCVAALIDLTFSSWLELLVSRGAASLAHRMQVTCLLLRLPGLALILPFGMIGAAVGVLVSSLLVGIFVFFQVSRFTALSARDAVQSLVPSALTALACAGPAALTLWLILNTPQWPLAWLVPAAPVIGAVWMAVLAASGHPLWPELQLLLARLRGAVVQHGK